MANPILITGAAGRVGAVGRTVTELLLQQGKAVRAMVRKEDERAQEIIVIGLIARTCVEATVRYGAELGYDVTVVKDAIADYSDVEMRAALEVNMPNYASAIVRTDEIAEAISFL